MNLPNESSDTYLLEVLRYDESRDVPPRFEAFEIPRKDGTSLLSALSQIQDEQDPSLAFRCACRGLVCGSCGVVVNGRPTLACRTRLAELHSRRIVVEPLPGFEVIRDLVVDLDPFWEKYKQVQPWLHATADPGTTRMSEKDRKRIDQFANCILCGLCYSSCPAAAMNDEFTGPAALAKLYRFAADSREDRGPQTLAAQNNNSGAWGCRMATRCVDVCPKNVRPLDGITGVRRKLVAQSLLSMLRWSRNEE